MKNVPVGVRKLFFIYLYFLYFQFFYTCVSLMGFKILARKCEFQGILNNTTAVIFYANAFETFVKKIVEAYDPVKFYKDLKLRNIFLNMVTSYIGNIVL